VAGLNDFVVAEELRTQGRPILAGIGSDCGGHRPRVETRATVGSGLARCAERFAYTAMLKAIEGYQPKSAGRSV
jgi:hypothetical protein